MTQYEIELEKENEKLIREIKYGIDQYQKISLRIEKELDIITLSLKNQELKNSNQRKN